MHGWSVSCALVPGLNPSLSPTNALAALPDAVTFAQAATLPLGPTALYALTKRGLLLHRRVCITGATGGVGDFAIQLAHLARAQVIAQVRRPDQVAVVKQVAADDVVIWEDPAAFAQHAPYDLVLESVGGMPGGGAGHPGQRWGVCVVGRFGLTRSHL